MVLIDEAAAIPITIVKQLIGPYLCVLSSTVNGYEGTGRSLSLKLVNQLRDQSRSKASGGSNVGRQLKELKLDEPIRYGEDDKVEKWLE